MIMTHIDNRLQLGYGSAWHVLRCLGYRRKAFCNHISQAIGANSIEWRDFLAGGTGLYPTLAPIRDSEWTRVDFAPDVIRNSYDGFWPRAGSQQTWDLIGLADIGGPRRELVLVEAKAHTAEINLDGTTAKENGGRPAIRGAFTSTLLSMGYSVEEAAPIAEKWLTGCYQHANRLATLYFLLREKVPARLVFLYFCGDMHPQGKWDCPKSPDEWRPSLDKVKNHLGLRGDSNLETRVHDVFVDVDSIEIGEKP
jgi:hypothetical protein